MEKNDQAIPVASLFFSVPFETLLTALELGPVYKHANLLTSAEAIGHLNKLDACLVIVSVNSREDLAQLVQVHRAMTNPKSGKCFKFIVVTRMGAAFDKTLFKLGLKEFIELRVPPKALRSKLDFWAKSLKAQLQARASVTPPRSGSVESVTSGMKHLKPGEVIWEEGIYFPEDIWKVQDTGDVKRIDNRWLIRLEGPSPDVADWIETEVKGSWKLSFKMTENSTRTFKGAWVFRGSQAPTFLQKDNVWVFNSDELNLSYVIGGKVQFSRLKTEGLSIFVQRNSKASKLDGSFVTSGSSNLSPIPPAQYLEVETQLQLTPPDQPAASPWYLDGQGYKHTHKSEEAAVEAKDEAMPSDLITNRSLSQSGSLPELLDPAPARVEENQDSSLTVTATESADDGYQRRLKFLLEKGARQFRR